MIEKGSVLKRGYELVLYIVFSNKESVDSVRRVSIVHLLLVVQEFKCALIFGMFFFCILFHMSNKRLNRILFHK